MFGRLNNGWSHMAVYGFAYPMILLMLVAPLCAVMLGMGKREKREGDRRFVSHFQWNFSLETIQFSAKPIVSNDLAADILWMAQCSLPSSVYCLVLFCR